MSERQKRLCQDDPDGTLVPAAVTIARPTPAAALGQRHEQCVPKSPAPLRGMMQAVEFAYRLTGTGSPTHPRRQRSSGDAREHTWGTAPSRTSLIFCPRRPGRRP
jgi:hypothetical protein